MRTLYHYPLCASCRVVRFMLAEKKLDFSCSYQVPWKVGEEVFEHNIAGTLPVFVDISGTSVFGSSAIREYIEDVYPEPGLIGEDPVDRAEARRMADWFDYIFAQDVYFQITDEKIRKRLARGKDRTPNPANIREALLRLPMHFEYLSWLIDRRNWLGGKSFSVADIYAASFISVLDYLGMIQWNKYETVKQWYARIKSRPTFRSILSDNLSQLPPSSDYANLDF